MGQRGGRRMDNRRVVVNVDDSIRIDYIRDQTGKGKRCGQRNSICRAGRGSTIEGVVDSRFENCDEKVNVVLALNAVSGRLGKIGIEKRSEDII